MSGDQNLPIRSVLVNHHRNFTKKLVVDSTKSFTVKLARKGARKVARVFRYNLLNKDEDVTTVDDHLRKLDELCRGRIIPMSSRLIEKVKNIYKRCQSEDNNDDGTPVMKAASLGLVDMVWGFIECANQTSIDLHTRKRLQEPPNFLWLKNKWNRTALDVAIGNNHMEVAKLLLNNASPSQLLLEWNSKGKSLLPVLTDSKYDSFIFDMLEKTKQEVVVRRSTPMLQQQDERRKYLKILDDGLLGSNPNENSFLHLVSKLGDAEYVNRIIKENPSQIYSLNFEGETPAYVAAREGHADILKIMINSLKAQNDDIESLLTRRKDKHNALHIAIQNHHAEVIFWLLEEIPQLANRINDFNESPLYLAAERGYFAILALILKKCEEKAFVGRNGKTALHAAAISNSAECISYLLRENLCRLSEKDEKGWTPLHHAVYHNSSLATKVLLYADYSVGYDSMTDKNISTSAIHIAASRGHCETMKLIMEICLGCSEFIDSKGRNILHVAIENKKTEVIEFIFGDESLTSLINQKDNNGDTPAHLLVTSNLDIMERVMDSRVDIYAVNNKKLTPLDLLTSDEKKDILIKGITKGISIHKKAMPLSPNISKSDPYEKELEAKAKELEAHFKIVDNLVLVVTLIATATFAAGFTVPGGFDSNNGSKQGTPYLIKKSAFQAFVITNAIAFSCSCSVLLGHIVLLIFRNSYNEATGARRKYIDDRIVVMYFFTGIALLAMLIAFITGLYVVLTPFLWLAILVCAMSLFIVGFSLFA